MNERLLARLAGPVGALACGIAAMLAVPAAAQVVPVSDQTSLSLRDTFPIGSNGLCEAQILSPEPGAGLFDRRYSVICRDAAAPVGTLWVVRAAPADAPAARFAGDGSTCTRSDAAPAAPGLPDAERLICAREGKVSPARVVDHIRPHRGDVELFWDRSNWQPLCKPCHDRVKQSEEARGYSHEIGEDGWPLDPKHPANRRERSRG